MATAERGQGFEAQRAIDFENWQTFFRSMTPNRIAILEHVPRTTWWRARERSRSCLAETIPAFKAMSRNW